MPSRKAEVLFYTVKKPWDPTGTKLKEFADDNFKFDEDGRKFFKWFENPVGKGEIACYVKTRAC